MPWGHCETEDGELYHGAFDTKEDAISDGRAHYDGAFYVIEGSCQSPSSLMPDADDIIESAANRAGDECGEAADEWPDVTDEAKAELNAFLSEWAEKHAPVKFWNATGNAERIEPEDQE